MEKGREKDRKKQERDFEKGGEKDRKKGMKETWSKEERKKGIKRDKILE